MAALLGCSRPTIAKWVDMGAPCASRGRKGVSAEFDAPAFVQWWREHIVEAADEAPDTLSEREQLADIHLKELRLAQDKANWVPRVVVAYVLRSMLEIIRSTFRRGPQRYAHRLVDLPDTATAVEVLSVIAEEQLAELRRPETWRSLADGAQEAAAQLSSTSDAPELGALM